MTNTTNMGLSKINSSDYVDPEVFNTNYDLLDNLGICYITGTGTSGIWKYRKWSNGWKECWGEQTWSGVNCNQAWGGMYETTNTYYLDDYPTGFFTSAPFVTINVTGLTSGSGIATLGCVEVTYSGTSTKAPGFHFLRGSSGSLSSVTVAAHAITYS